MDLEELETQARYRRRTLPESKRKNVRIQQRWPRPLYIVARNKAIKDGWPSFSHALRGITWAWVRGEITVKVDKKA